MDYLSLLLLFFLTFLIFHVFKSKILHRNPLSLPLGPRPFPIIGNILEMGTNPHQSLANLSKKFGPLMTLKLGSITAIVISSPDYAKEALQKHDQALSGRAVPDAARIHGRDKFSTLWLPALDQWRSLRKVMTSEMFTSQKLEESQDLRREKVRKMLVYVGENCKIGESVDIGHIAFTTILNILSNTFFSIDLASYNSNISLEFYDAVVGILEEFGKPNLADYFPLLQITDPQGIRRRTDLYFERLFNVLDRIIAERLQLKLSSTTIKDKQDVLDSLLSISQEENNSPLSLNDIKHLLADLFIPGTDIAAKTLEWGMTELLRNPEKLLKLKNELKEVEGEIQESDINKLPYLQATLANDIKPCELDMTETFGLALFKTQPLLATPYL
ncbi:Cytochrome P450 76T24 [Euphorbia peplus]|nr:Cytochrome P450 76T24 [Euphorbia peplus]